MGLITCLAAGWAIGRLARQILTNRASAKDRRHNTATGTITMDEAHTIIFDLRREQDIIGRLNRETSR